MKKKMLRWAISLVSKEYQSFKAKKVSTFLRPKHREANTILLCGLKSRSKLNQWRNLLVSWNGSAVSKKNFLLNGLLIRYLP